MVDTILIDLKALMVEREDCDAGTVEKLRAALAQGKTQYRSLRESAEALKKKVEANASNPSGKRWHLKLAIAQYFLGRDVFESFMDHRVAGGKLGVRVRGHEVPRISFSARAKAAFTQALNEDKSGGLRFPPQEIILTFSICIRITTQEERSRWSTRS